MSITADLYCEELNTMVEKSLKPALVNRSFSLLLHDNARLHTAQQTVSKLQGMGLEALCHLSMSFVDITVFPGITIDANLQCGPHIFKLASRLTSVAYYAVRKIKVSKMWRQLD
ncbi:unnamed protein product [Parnassius mnemosyne]|uniref:Transposase n=1 Tax=Parnassius mnemosyne TaxID=213953 RepID=A0AAV1L1V5_9NEOP